MKIKKPDLDWKKILGVGMVMIGMLFFLVSIHITAISTTGSVSAVLATTFKVFLYIYVGCVVFGMAGIVIQMLRWLTWKIETPEWKQNEGKG